MRVGRSDVDSSDSCSFDAEGDVVRGGATRVVLGVDACGSSGVDLAEAAAIDERMIVDLGDLCELSKVERVSGVDEGFDVDRP